MHNSHSYRHGFMYRQGFNAGWRNEPMPINACPAYRNGWHVGRMRLLKAEMDILGVTP